MSSSEPPSPLTGKLEAYVEIEAPAEKFHHMLLHKPHQVSDASPNHVQACDLHHSDWGKEGSIICWNYTLNGKPKSTKELIESIDAKNNSTTFRVIEGDLTEDYKSLVVKVTATPSGKGPGCVVHWLLEYEKMNEEVAHPEKTLEMLVEICKNMGTHITKPDNTSVDVSTKIKA